jgi:hypothetical protein
MQNFRCNYPRALGNKVYIIRQKKVPMFFRRKKVVTYESVPFPDLERKLVSKVPSRILLVLWRGFQSQSENTTLIISLWINPQGKITSKVHDNSELMNN